MLILLPLFHSIAYLTVVSKSNGNFDFISINTTINHAGSESMGEIFKIIGDLGMPVAAALGGGYFVYLTIKLLLQGVLGSIKGMAGIITALDNRVKTMNHDVIRIDTIVSNALGLRPDVDRIARADGKNDARRD